MNLLKRPIYEILELAGKQRSNEGKVQVLKQYDCVPLRTVLRHFIDDNIKFFLPEGDPPYKPNPEPGCEFVLYNHCRLFYLFTQENTAPQIRERKFVELLQNVDANDAPVLLAMKNKKLPNNLSKKVILEAFPDLVDE